MEELSNDRRIIFVGGAERSGTTLVQNILDSHPDICGLPEFHLIKTIMDMRDEFYFRIEHKMIDLICSYKEVDDHIYAFVESFLSPLFNRYKCKILSEKTPNNVMVFKKLIVLFPKAKVIHVVRDPRAVISSLFEIGRKAKVQGQEIVLHAKSMRAAIRHVQCYQRAGFDVAKQAPDKILTVVYERLVMHLEEETKRICKFLNIDWADQMMKPGELKHIGESGQTCKLNSLWYDMKIYNRNPEVSSIDKWKRTLTPAQQVRITNIFKDCQELIDLGYDFSLGHLSARQKLFGTFQSAARARIGDMRLAAGRSLKRLLPA